jgi:formylglycine-generating enzyme required for sulfatase activity
MKKAKILAALTVGVGVACDAYGSANADTAKLAQLLQQPASVKASATFAKIPAGTFQMGSPSSESGRYDNEILHSVTISHGFEMEVTDVTQLQWFRVMGNNPAHFKARQYCQSDHISMNGIDLCPNNPVEPVSWDDVQAIIAKLNQANEGYTYRLPTEAERGASGNARRQIIAEAASSGHPG